MFFAHPVLADCGGGSYYVWPQGKQLNPNAIIMIQGSDDKCHYVDGIGIKYPAFLVCDSVRVKLEAFERHKSEFGLTQVLLRPAHPLRSGAVYHLQIDSLPLDEKGPLRYNYDNRKYEKYQWFISDSQDVSAPTWTDLPKVSRKTYVRYGCGPEMHVYFNYHIADASPLLLRTTVTNTDTKKKSTYCVTASDTMVGVGMHMCTGEFILKPDVIYEVTFDIIDASGNNAVWQRKPILFTAATKETE
jgi:hypothetical protein